MKRGFDEFFGFLRGAHSFLPDIPIIIFPDKNGEGVDFGATEQGRSRLDGQILRGYDVVREENYLTDAFGREAVSFIKRHEAEPFFLYLSFNAVHTPMHADDLRFEKFSNIEDPVRRIYNAMTLAMDDAVGEVMAQLRRSNLEEKTLVFFISDNGGPTVLRYAYNASSNAPLRGSKGTALEGGIRVPFVASWPGVLSAGVNHDEAVIQLDIMPTILAAAGLDIPSELDGINLLPQLRGERSDRPKGALFWKSLGQMAVRQGDWKLVTYPEMINHGELPRGFDQDAGPLTLPQLYNLQTDIGEHNDLAAAEPERVAELQALWNEWNAEIGQSNQRIDPQ